MEKDLKHILLLDFYGDLLTEKQKQVMSLYYNNDVSLSEIAEELSLSRQAIYDTVKVSENSLNNFESKLKCVEKYLNNRKLIMDCLGEIDNSLDKDNQLITNIKSKLNSVLDNL